jgi:hypothetical protein
MQTQTKRRKNVDRIDRIDSNNKHTRFADSGNNTPELGKEQPPREEKLVTVQTAGDSKR